MDPRDLGGKVATALIDSAAEDAARALGVLSKVAGAGVGIFAWLATAPATAPASIDEAPRSQTVPDAQNSSKRHTRNKHTNKHASRTSDKLRKRETWDDKKFGRKGNQKRGNDHNDSN
jgi:hypothetical protein